MAKVALAKYSPEDSIIYKIPYCDLTCVSAHYGQTSRGLEMHLHEDMQGFKKGD